MLRLILWMIVEAVMGLAVGGLVLGILLPVLIRRHLVEQGDVVGVAVICVVMLITVGTMLFRPGSALHRFGKSN